MLLHTYTKLTEVGKAGDLTVYRIVLLSKFLRVLTGRRCMPARKCRHILEIVFLLLEALVTGIFALVPNGRLTLLSTDTATLFFKHLCCVAFKALLSNNVPISFKGCELLRGAAEERALHLNQVSSTKVRLLRDRVNTVGAHFPLIPVYEVLLVALATNLHSHGAFGLTSCTPPQVLMDQPRRRLLTECTCILNAYI